MTLEARIQIYALALLDDAPVFDAAPQGIRCGELAAYHVDRLGSRSDTREDARRVEAILSQECEVSL